MTAADHIADNLSSQSASTQAKAPGRVLNPLYSLRSHWFMAIAVAGTVLGLGMPVAWWKGAPVYSTEAVVYVSPHFVKNLEDDKEAELQSNTQYREYVQQNVRTIDRYDIVAEALNRLGPARSVWQGKRESARSATERLQGELDIQSVPDTYQIVVGLESGKGEGLADVVNAVVETYLEKAKHEEFYDADKRIETLNQDGARLLSEIDGKLAKRMALSQELGVSSFTESLPNPYDRLLVGSKEALAEATRRRIEADAQFSVINRQAGPDSERALEAFARDYATKDPELTSIQASVNQRRSELLSKVSGLSPDHPGRRAAARELEELDKERNRTYDGLISSYSSMLLEQRKAEAAKARRAETGLRAEDDRQTALVSWFTQKFQEALVLGGDIEHERKRLDAIKDRMNFLTLETRAPGFVRMFSRARPPEPTKSKRKKLLLLIVGASAALGLLLPIGIDWLDPRIHGIRDAHRVLGFAPLGWLPVDGVDADFAHEQALSFANRLDQERLNAGTRIFAFTSVLPGGGVTSIVTRIARALAELGVPTLAVEANAYRSDRRYAGAGAGLTVVLQGNYDLADVILPATGDMPDRIAVGDVGPGRNLPDIHRLIGLLRDGAEQYALVLLDLPPLLLSVDAEYIARSADAVVLVCEAVSVKGSDLKRAASALERLRPHAVASIVNKVRMGGLDTTPDRALNEYIRGRKVELPAWMRWIWS